MHNPARLRESGSLATLSLRLAMALSVIMSSSGAGGCQADATAHNPASVEPAVAAVGSPSSPQVGVVAPAISPPVATPVPVAIQVPPSGPPTPAIPPAASHIGPTIPPLLLLASPLIIAAGKWVAPSNPSPVVMTETAGPLVRVRLLAGSRGVRLTSGQAPTMVSSGWQQARPLDAVGKPVLIRRVAGGWEVGATKLDASGNALAATSPANTLPGVLTISPAAPKGGTFSPLEVEGVAYRGQIRLVPVTGGDGAQFDVVNDVGLEDYLLSVVSAELISSFHPEAFAAQAVVARTYAMFEVRTAGITRHWDVWADTRSQVYGGIGVETPRAAAAVKTTRGVVVAYGPSGPGSAGTDAGAERIFKTYFAACCGGIGQSAADAFAEPPLPPLGEKNAGSLCRGSPSYKWSALTVTKAELARRIRAWATRRSRPELQVDSVRSLEVNEKNRFGRPVKFDVVDARGGRAVITGEELRWAVNAGMNASDKDLWSSFMAPVDTGDAIRFSGGSGMGHGVGMCQWCAQGMALRGDKHEAIIAWSYPGSVLKKAYP